MVYPSRIKTDPSGFYPRFQSLGVALFLLPSFHVANYSRILVFLHSLQLDRYHNIVHSISLFFFCISSSCVFYHVLYNKLLCEKKKCVQSIFYYLAIINGRRGPLHLCETLESQPDEPLVSLFRRLFHLLMLLLLLLFVL